MSKPWYICGPMSGIPQYNIPQFDEAAAALRREGYEVLSPAELDAPEIRAKYLASPDGASLPDTPTWGTFLSRDITIIADSARGLVLLDGWWRSRGAKLEVFTALLCGHEFTYYDSRSLSRVSVDQIRIMLRSVL